MSYAPQNCRDNFSPMGNARMYAAFHIYRSYYECPSFNVGMISEELQPDCDDNLIVNYFDDSVGAIAWEWDVNGDDIIDYTIENPSHIYSPGTYDVALTISNGSETLTKVFPQYINFSSNIYETSSVNLKLFIIDTNQNNWEISNSSGEIIYEGGPYDQFGEYNHEFEILQSECYTFTIFDSAGDGLDASNWNLGNEYYELTTDDGTLIHENTDFGYEESTMISTQYLNLDGNKINRLTLFPNPASDFMKINYNNEIPNKYNIYDVNGRLIYSKIIRNEYDLRVNTGVLEKGLYIISIELNHKLENLKFLVN